LKTTFGYRDELRYAKPPQAIGRFSPTPPVNELVGFDK
jgi:hypothetical protein